MWRGCPEDALDIASNYGKFPHTSIPLPDCTAFSLLREIEWSVSLLKSSGPDLMLTWMLLVDRATDGARLAGFTDEQIVEALVAKQTKNEGRVWPDWRTMSADQAIEHVRNEETV
ncbi:MAG: DUF550 domain-containing protein [Patescibacteria group bacterium]|nr:DUF550 domain-containing protein [Patescibacteria group bacterium]